MQLDDAVAFRPQPATLYVFWDDDGPVGRYFTDTTDLSCFEVAMTEARNARAARRGLPAPSRAIPDTVTVVICTRDRPEELERCLRSFREQSRTPDQIVIVDNASRDDRTRQVALAAGVEYVREDRPGLDIARNAGARAARGEIVAYTDDDVVLDPRWLERLVGAFSEEEIWAVTGLVLPAELATEAQWQFEHYWGFGRGFRRKDFSPERYTSLRPLGFPAWEIGAGASMAFRKSVFETVGYFDERLDVGAAGCSGDSEFWNRILHCGGTCRYEPRAVAFHYHRREWKGLRKQLRAYMSGHVVALLVQYERTGERGNVRRLLVSVPAYYARKLLGLLRHRTGANATVFDEILGCLDGLVFYMRAKRPPDVKRLQAVLPSPKLPTDTPLVGVVVPAFNAADTIDKTLRSIRMQTYQKLEIIVVDDGSTDDTAEIARSHAAEDSRIRVIAQANQGVAAARNAGIHASSAEFIAPVDADDLCHPEKFERQVKAMLSAGEACGLVYGLSATIDERDRITKEAGIRLFEGYVLEPLLSSNFIGNGSSPLMRRKAVQECGGYDPELRRLGAQGCEDLKLYLGIAERYDFAVVPLPVTGYRVTSQNMSADINQMIRSHRLVVEPYAQRYPEYRDSVRMGHIYLAVHYIERAFLFGQFRRAYGATREILRYNVRVSAKALVRTLISSVRRRLSDQHALQRLGLAPSKQFPQNWH